MKSPNNRMNRIVSLSGHFRLCRRYLDRFFGNREGMLTDLNAFVERFNRHWDDYADVPPYNEDDLHKLCMQNATGSGKTLLMHINLLQYRHYVAKHGKDKELSRVILPVALGESEYQFVTDLKTWCDGHKAALEKDGMELFLLRNMSRGKGVGFFEPRNLHPAFILWILIGGKQYVTFIEPHGLLHEGPASEKILFHKRIKDVEQRLKDPAVILNSFILSWTRYPQLK